MSDTSFAIRRRSRPLSIGHATLIAVTLGMILHSSPASAQIDMDPESSSDGSLARSAPDPNSLPSRIEQRERCKEYLTFYGSLQESKILEGLKLLETERLETEEAIASLQRLNYFTDSANLEAIRNWVRITPVLDTDLFWDAIADALKEHGFRKRDSLISFAASLKSAEIPAAELDQLLESILHRLPRTLPEPTLGNLHDITRLQKAYALTKEQYALLRRVLDVSTDEKRLLLKNSIVGLIYSRNAQFVDQVSQRNSTWYTWTKRRPREATLEHIRKAAAPRARSNELQNGPEVAQALIHALAITGYRKHSSKKQLLALEAGYEYILSVSGISDLDYYHLLENLPVGMEEISSKRRFLVESELAPESPAPEGRVRGAYRMTMDLFILLEGLKKVRTVHDRDRFTSILPEILSKMKETCNFNLNRNDFREYLINLFAMHHEDILKRHGIPPSQSGETLQSESRSSSSQ